MMKLVWLIGVVCLGIWIASAGHTGGPNPDRLQQLNEACRGDPNATPDSAVCRERDRLTAQREHQSDPPVVSQIAANLPPYDSTVGAAARKIGAANAMVLCGLRSSEWYGQITADLERQIEQYIFDLPHDQEKAERIYAAVQAKISQDFSLRGHGVAGCRELSEMPYTKYDTAFLP